MKHICRDQNTQCKTFFEGGLYFLCLLVVIGIADNPVLSGAQGKSPENAQVSNLASGLSHMQGCDNPNVGISQGVWGPASSLYVPLTYETKLIGTPAYTKNSVFWTSRENGPAESVLMTGAFTAGTKTVKVSLIPTGTMDWQSIVMKRGQKAPLTQQGTTGLSFVVPGNLSHGVYGFELDDASAPTIFGLINAPSISWAVGVPSNIDSAKALQSQVRTCGAEPGEILRLFGKNFTSSDQIILQSSNGTVYRIAPLKVDPDALSAPIPSTLSPGFYRIWVGTYPWSSTSSSVETFTVYPISNSRAKNVSCSGMMGNGIADNSAVLQSCLDNFAPSGNQLVHLDIPSGTFLFRKGIALRTGEMLVGASETSAQFVWQPASSAATTFITLSRFTGLANLSIKGPSNSSLANSLDSTGNPQLSGHLFVNDVMFGSFGDVIDRVSLVQLAGPDIQVYNSTFDSASFGNLTIMKGDGGILAGNTFIDDTSFLGIEGCQNIIVESNSATSRGGPNPSGSAFVQLSRPFNGWGRSMLLQDIYVGYNKIQNIGSSKNQIIVTDGGGGAYYGGIAATTANTVTLANDPSWIWVGNSNPLTMDIAIIAGTGVGQYSIVSGANGRTLNLETPWIVRPDSSSVVEMTTIERSLSIAHNAITNTLGTSIYLQGTIEVDVEDNTLTNSGTGIRVAAYGPYGGPEAFPPLMDTDVLRNTIAIGKGDLITPSQNTNVGGIGVFDGYGGAVSGLMIRGNQLPANQTIFSTNGYNGINAVVIEDNIANWVGPNISGFLVHGNSKK